MTSLDNFSVALFANQRSKMGLISASMSVRGSQEIFAARSHDRRDQEPAARTASAKISMPLPSGVVRHPEPPIRDSQGILQPKIQRCKGPPSL